jgi:TonB-linked SusC/RagA family outer membrane protein
VNPLAQIANTFNDARVNKLVGKEELVYKINSDFEVTGRAGYNYAIVDDKSFSPPVYYGSGKAMNTALNANLDPRITTIATGVEIPVYNTVTERRTTYLNYNFEAFVNYNKSIGEDHKVKGTLGTAIFTNTSNFLSGTGYNVPYSSWDFADITAAEGANLLNNTSSGQTEERLQSFFGRAEYGYKGKYLLSALIRRDGSSNFGKNNRFGYFPAASFAWVLSDESFFQSSVLEFVKIRASYGVSGNDKIGYFRYRALLGGEGVYPFNDQLTTGTAIGTLGNQDLKWETTRQTNIGADLTLLNGKLDITTDYYIKKTFDLLFQPDVSAIIGAYGAGGSPPWINGGDVKNSGFEFLINYKDQIGEDFQFNIGYNLTTIRNRVTSMPSGKEFIESGSFGVGGSITSRMQTGFPLGYFYGFKTDGVYQTAEEVASRGVTQNGAQPGDLRFVDKDNSGSINFGDNSDKMMIGSPIPDVVMGLNLGFNFKGFDFSTTFYSSIGNDILRNYERQQPMANMLSYRLDRWTGAGTTNEHPRLTTGANNNGVISDYFVEDGSFVRIKNLQLGYSLPASISKRIGATKVRVYIAANNLATFTRYKGYDPDQSNSNPLVSGVDTGFYPQAKTFMGGLNLNF